MGEFQALLEIDMNSEISAGAHSGSVLEKINKVPDHNLYKLQKN